MRMPLKVLRQRRAPTRTPGCGGAVPLSLALGSGAAPAWAEEDEVALPLENIFPNEAIQEGNVVEFGGEQVALEQPVFEDAPLATRSLTQDMGEFIAAGDPGRAVTVFFDTIGEVWDGFGQDLADGTIPWDNIGAIFFLTAGAANLIFLGFIIYNFLFGPRDLEEAQRASARRRQLTRQAEASLMGDSFAASAGKASPATPAAMPAEKGPEESVIEEELPVMPGFVPKELRAMADEQVAKESEGLSLPPKLPSETAPAEDEPKKKKREMPSFPKRSA